MLIYPSYLHYLFTNRRQLLFILFFFHFFPYKINNLLTGHRVPKIKFNKKIIHTMKL